uniref:Probable G-protein coupled receptor 33 n=1 Tax=Chrysemys picta bellii TaxID=8478 RepID=A0A8C3HS79_CHRPI
MLPSYPNLVLITSSLPLSLFASTVIPSNPSSVSSQGTMEQNISALPPTTVANSSKTTEIMKISHLASAVLLFITFLVGVVGNGMFLWVLGLKMRRTVTTLWFLHLVSCYLLFTLLIPFFAIYVLLGFHWVFGMAMCKLLNAFGSMGMFSSVFLLTLISLDRYTLTHHPIWSRNHRTMPRAWTLVVGVWLASFSLSAPYLTRNLGRQTHLAIFMVRFLLGFLLPFCTIVGCYVRVGLKMKEKKLTWLAWAGKPFKVIVTTVVSFFLGWLPYHLYHGLKLSNKEVPGSVMGALLVIYTFTSCFNACFTPILYLFVGEKFWQVFRTSLLTLVKAAFVDDLGSSASESTPGPLLQAWD